MIDGLATVQMQAARSMADLSMNASHQKLIVDKGGIKPLARMCVRACMDWRRLDFASWQ